EHPIFNPCRPTSGSTDALGRYFLRQMVDVAGDGFFGAQCNSAWFCGLGKADRSPAAPNLLPHDIADRRSAPGHYFLVLVAGGIVILVFGTDADCRRLACFLL